MKQKGCDAESINSICTRLVILLVTYDSLILCYYVIHNFIYIGIVGGVEWWKEVVKNTEYEMIPLKGF